MTQARNRERSLTLTLTAVLAIVAAMLVLASPARAAGYEDLLTDHQVEITETVSDAGFVHPGIGLSAADLRNAQQMVHAGEEPWASYFEVMSTTGFASRTWRASNSKSAAEPDVASRPELHPCGPARPRDQ